MKRVWLTSTMGVALLMIGPNGFLHRLLFEVFPPMWFMRHTSALVLYFLMGVLYFFVLGCNELVARWKGEGVAGTAMKEDSANGPSWLRYSVLMFFGFVIWPLCSEMILSELQERRFVPHWLGLLFFGGFGIWRYLGRGWFFASLVVGQIAAVLVHSYTPLLFLVRLILMGVLPAAVFALAFRYFPRERRTRNAVTIPVCTLILVAGCGDLVFSHYRMTWMYRMDRLIQLGPRATVQATPLSYTDFRAISPNREDVSWDEVRYRSLLERKPYAFASVVKQANANSWAVGAEQQTLMARPGDEFEMARQVLRINSLFLLRNYFRLVNSPVPSPVLKEIFAIDRPLFRFSPGGPFLDEETYIKESQAASVVARLKSAEDLAAGARAGESLDRSDSTLWAVFLEQHSGSGPEEDSRNVFDYVVERFTSNGIVLAVKSMHAGLLYWADGYDPSWRASVDGKPVEILRAHMNFKAISIPAGTSRVQFAYEPRRFEAALGLFNLAALIPALVWGAERAGGHRPVRAEG